MLKSIAALAFTFVALSAHAQTGFSIQPEYPVNCLKHDYPLVNQVSKVTKVSEDASKAVFSFKTALGACDAGVFNLRDGIGNAVVQTIKNKLILFGKENVKSSIEVLSRQEAMITLSFDKKPLFKKTDVQKFTMFFYPNYQAPVLRVDTWGRHYYQQYQNLYFPWAVTVTKLSETESNVEVGLL